MEWLILIFDTVFGKYAKEHFNEHVNGIWQ